MPKVFFWKKVCTPKVPKKDWLGLMSFLLNLTIGYKYITITTCFNCGNLVPTRQLPTFTLKILIPNSSEWKSWYLLFKFQKSVLFRTNFFNLKSRYQLFDSEKSGTNFLNLRKLVPTFWIWEIRYQLLQSEKVGTNFFNPRNQVTNFQFEKSVPIF